MSVKSCPICLGRGMKTPMPSPFNGPCESCGGTGHRDCENYLHRCMDMDLDPYCLAVNKPYGRVLHRGVPEECGEERKLWKRDSRPDERRAVAALTCELADQPTPKVDWDAVYARLEEE